MFTEVQYDEEDCVLLVDFPNRAYPDDPHAGAQGEYKNVTHDLVNALKQESERPGGSVGVMLRSRITTKPADFPFRYTREARK